MILSEKHCLIRKLVRDFCERELTAELLDQVEESGVFPVELQQKMAEMQEELDAREFEASSGGGMVLARVNGKKEVLGISIKPEAVDPDDVEMLEDMVLAAVNEALFKEFLEWRRKRGNN